MPKKKSGTTGRTNIEREDRSMSGAGASGDQSSGNEGVDDPAISRDHRDDLDSAGVDTRLTTGSERMDAGQQGRAMKRSSSEHSTRGQDNDRQQGRESTDNNSRSFSGQAGQKEGSNEPEGTGYTNDASRDTSDSGDPLT